MEDKNPGKPPLSPLLAPASKTERKRKPATKKAETKKKLDQARGQTCVNIGSAFQWWRQLWESMGLKNDTMTAEFLLDR